MSEALVSKEAAEARALGRLMGENYRASLEHYKDLHQRYGQRPWREALELAERDTDAKRSTEDHHIKRLLRKPLQDLDWYDLEALEVV